MTILPPIIERLGEDIPLISKEDVNHKQAAMNICRYLEHRDKDHLQNYYASVEYLLSDPEYERLLLYLPFVELHEAPDSFRKIYMNVWWNLTNVKDVAENFHEGDILEADARPYGQLQYVVKCAHLLPWLLESDYISKDQIASIFHDGSYDLLISGIRDTLPYIQDRGLLSKQTVDEFTFYSRHIPYRGRLKPLYVSDKRKQWLEEKDKQPSPLATPEAQLQGPFFQNLKSIDIDKMTDNLPPNGMILVGGSRFKGYGTVDSDLDSWLLSDLLGHDEFYLGSPHASHIYFNTAWICNSPSVLYDSIIQDVLHMYDDPKNRRRSLERMEFDLILYRLLHKGFSRMTGIHHFETSSYLTMDGDCPFYHDGWRRIATMLFAKYVFIPHVNSSN